MISIYKEGQQVNLGVNIGWVRGPVFVWHWINLQKDTSITRYYRLAVSTKPIIWYNDVRRSQNYSETVVHSYTTLRGLELVTREFYDDAVKALKEKGEQDVQRN